MKRRNLFLSLICSIMLAVALVTFTVISVVPTKEKAGNNQTSQNVSDAGNQGDENLDPENPDVLINEGRDGSEEKPYVVYSTETFKTFVVDKYLDENGDYIDYNAVNEDGDYLYPNLRDGLYYELGNDIDFAGTDFVTVFNKGIAFNGHINGKGFAIKNITISVTKDNIDSFTLKNDEGRYEAHIGIFGELDGAALKDVKIENIKITVADEVYTYVKSGDFATEKGGAMKEITIGTIAAVTKATKEYKVDSLPELAPVEPEVEQEATPAADEVSEESVVAPIEIYVIDYTLLENVIITGSIDAGAYSVYAVNHVQGYNAMGGVFGVSDCVLLTNVTTDVEMIADEGKNYFVGGISGYAYKTIVTTSNIKTSIKTGYDQAIYIGGAFGYASPIVLNETNITLDVAEIGEERFNTKGVSQINDTEFTWVAGAIVKLHAKADNSESIIKDVNIVANVDIDGIYAGVVMDITSDATEKVIEITDVIVDSTVNVLKASGFARTVSGAVITLTKSVVDEVNEIDYNVRLLGQVRLNKNTDYNNRLVVASAFIGNFSDTTFTNGFASVKPVVSYKIYAQLEAIDTVRPWGNKVNGTTNWAI